MNETQKRLLFPVKLDYSALYSQGTFQLLFNQIVIHFRKLATLKKTASHGVYRGFV